MRERPVGRAFGEAPPLTMTGQSRPYGLARSCPGFSLPHARLVNINTPLTSLKDGGAQTAQANSGSLQLAGTPINGMPFFFFQCVLMFPHFTMLTPLRPEHEGAPPPPTCVCVCARAHVCTVFSNCYQICSRCNRAHHCPVDLFGQRRQCSTTRTALGIQTPNVIKRMPPTTTISTLTTMASCPKKHTSGSTADAYHFQYLAFKQLSILSQMFATLSKLSYSIAFTIKACRMPIMFILSYTFCNLDNGVSICKAGGW